MKLKRFKQINEEINVTENDRIGGISEQEYNQVIDFVGNLREKTKDDTITDEERVLSEVLHMIVTKSKNDLDYNTYYHRRLGYIQSNKKVIDPVKTMDFKELVWWLQDEYDWNYVESEGPDRVRFDWDHGDQSFWITDDRTIDGKVPDEVKGLLKYKGLKFEGVK